MRGLMGADARQQFETLEGARGAGLAAPAFAPARRSA
jgi:hypothetical protein